MDVWACLQCLLSWRALPCAFPRMWTGRAFLFLPDSPPGVEGYRTWGVMFNPFRSEFVGSEMSMCGDHPWRLVTAAQLYSQLAHCPSRNTHSHPLLEIGPTGLPQTEFTPLRTARAENGDCQQATETCSIQSISQYLLNAFSGRGLGSPSCNINSKCVPYPSNIWFQLGPNPNIVA